MKNERNTNGNSTLAIGGGSYSKDNFVVAESSVFRMKPIHLAYSYTSTTQPPFHSLLGS
jgi:hypothetical protein